MDIGLCACFSDEQVSRLRAAVRPDKLRIVGPDELLGCEVVFGNPAPEAIREGGPLRWLQLESVGFGEYADIACLKTGSIRMTNLAGFFAEPVAESILAGILALYRGMDRLVSFKEQRRWVGDDLRPQIRTLRGASVVLFGYGSINRRLEALLQPFDCRLTRFSRRWDEGQLDAALADADVVISTVPGTSATASLFDARRLQCLSAGSVFCNFGRGSLVDENALADALEQGCLRGAVIDVTNEEPLPANHRFWNCPNLLLTQHTGGGSFDEMDRKIDFFLANLQRFRAGQSLESVIDPARGY